MSTEQDVQEVIVQTLKVKPDELQLETSLSNSLGVDSTEIVDLIVALEKRFRVKINSKEITKDSSVNGIISLIKNKQA